MYCRIRPWPLCTHCFQRAGWVIPDEHFFRHFTWPLSKRLSLLTAKVFGWLLLVIGLRGGVVVLQPSLLVPVAAQKRLLGRRLHGQAKPLGFHRFLAARTTPSFVSPFGLIKLWRVQYVQRANLRLPGMGASERFRRGWVSRRRLRIDQTIAATLLHFREEKSKKAGHTHRW